jgi:hypothetical protein
MMQSRGACLFVFNYETSNQALCHAANCRIGPKSAKRDNMTHGRGWIRALRLSFGRSNSQADLFDDDRTVRRSRNCQRTDHG